ncbi:hypothetical protein O9993_04635 [Vibrio lentus]|nr:hypothetical protein [Vibrio lentus]
MLKRVLLMWFAPSDMMDGRIGKIREALEEAELYFMPNHGLLCEAFIDATTVRSVMRSAVLPEPEGGNKKNYQMDPAGWR